MNLEYRVVYSERKTITIIVERDRSITVRAPIGTTDGQIQKVIEAKKLWLYEKVNHPQKYASLRLKKEFVTGETIPYLGRNYRLEVVDEDIPGIKFDAGFFISWQNQANAALLFREWYTERAFERVPVRARYYAEALGVEYNQILISDLQVSWGTCTPKNNLNFNWRVMKAPSFVIDYLVVHELTHLVEANHTPRFWNIVAVQIPKFEKAKEWLLKNGDMLETDF